MLNVVLTQHFNGQFSYHCNEINYTTTALKGKKNRIVRNSWVFSSQKLHKYLSAAEKKLKHPPKRFYITKTALLKRVSKTQRLLIIIQTFVLIVGPLF